MADRTSSLTTISSQSWKGLSEDAVNRRGQEVISIVGGKDNGHEGIPYHLHYWS